MTARDLEIAAVLGIFALAALAIHYYFTGGLI